MEQAATSESGPWEKFFQPKTPSAPSDGEGPWVKYGGSAAPAQEPDAGGVNVMTQTLYDMAKTPEERKRALEHGYGAGNVKEDTNGLYIEHEGKRLSPKASGLGTKAAAFALSEAAPTIGAVGGGIGGAALGLGAGSVVGGVGGAFVGGASGQLFNDAMLKLAGVYDRDVGETAQVAGEAGALSALGEGGGRIAARGIAAAMHERGAIRGFARWALGVDHEELTRAAELAKQGVAVPPESYAPHSPMLGLVRTWAKKYGHDPVASAARPFYENQAGSVLKQLGVTEHQLGKLTEPTSAVSYEKTGQALIDKAKTKVAEEDAKFDEAVASMRAGMESRMTDAKGLHTKAISELEQSAEASRASAEKLIDAGWNEIDKVQDKMWSASKLGEEPGNLARDYATKTWALRKAVMRRARDNYSKADKVAGGATIDVSRFMDTAKAFVDQLPEDLQKQFPGLVRTLSEMDNRGMSFGEAHYLRSILRDIPNYGRLDPKFKDGVFKKLAGELNGAIHDSANPPKIKLAVKLLDDADKFYAKEMSRFKDNKIQAFTKQVRSGLPPDPDEVANLVLAGGYKERANEIRKIVGPEVWNATVAADIRGMMRESESLIPGHVEYGNFIKQVEDRLHSGTLDTYPPEVANALRDQARRAKAFEGRLDVPKLPDDDIKTFLTRAEDMKKQAKALAKINPEVTLKSELKRMESEFRSTQKQISKDRSADQLKFLLRPTIGAEEAARNIIESPDKLKAALLRFDADGPEIQMLRQTAARDILTMNLEGRGGEKLATRLEGLSDEVQKRLFPNGLDADVRKIASDMKFILKDSGDMGSSFSATGQVTNPLAGLPGFARRAAVGVPMFILRGLREEYIGKIANLLTSPQSIKWLAKGLRGTTEEREAVKKAVESTVQTGGNFGAGAGAVASQSATSPDDPVGTSGGGETWRDRYQERYGRAPQ